MIHFLSSIPPTVWAFLGTIFGGVGLKVVERWLNKSQTLRDDRKDYREEIKELQTRLDKVEDEVDTWRAKYWNAQEVITSLRQALISAGIPVPEKKE